MPSRQIRVMDATCFVHWTARNHGEWYKVTSSVAVPLCGGRTSVTMAECHTRKTDSKDISASATNVFLPTSVLRTPYHSTAKLVLYCQGSKH
jgi:hypothetical protein